MQELLDFRESNPFNDRIIQMALRETEANDLAMALYGQSEEVCSIIFRNMSQRAAALLRADMEAMKDCHEAACRVRRARFIGHVRKFERWAQENRGKDDIALPKLDDVDAQSFCTFFVDLRHYMKNHRDIDWMECARGVGHPVLRRGFELLADGHDPLTIQAILATAQKQYELKQALFGEMLLAGFDSLMAADEPQVVREKMRGFFE